MQRVGRAGGLAEGQLGIGDGVQLARVLRSSAWAQRIARAGLAKVACIPITGALDVAAPKPANVTRHGALPALSLHACEHAGGI